MAHISDYPAVLNFLTSYWFETADLVYGESGITAAAQQYVEDHSRAGDRDGACQRLSADLMRLTATDFVCEPAWDSEDYQHFWKHRGVHRVLVPADVEALFGVLRLGAA